MKLELVSFESDCKVALGDPVPASLEGHLVAGQPAVVTHHSSAVDGRAVDVIVHVAADVDVVDFVARLELAALLAGETLSAGGQDGLAPDRLGTCGGLSNGLSSRLTAAPFSIVLTQCWERRRSRTSASVPWPAEEKREEKKKKSSVSSDGLRGKLEHHRSTQPRGVLASAGCRENQQGRCLAGAPVELAALQYI